MKKDLDSIILTRQELQIMKVVWDRGAATVKEVCDVISERKVTAYTTILTLMGILEDKGALSHVRSGRAFIYKPLLSRHQATKNQVRDLITRLFDGKPERLFESVLEEASREQLGAVRLLLEARSENQVA
jgi:BlaI family transcriptional regulator, penicillinase repressor